MKKRVENETPEQRFARVATARTNAVLDKLRLLGNCSNKRIYRYSEQDMDKIFNAINAEIRQTKLKFSGKKKGKFSL